jgi:hypothetical protein
VFEESSKEIWGSYFNLKIVFLINESKNNNYITLFDGCSIFDVQAFAAKHKSKASS